jgi:hypothetical protein
MRNGRLWVGLAVIALAASSVACCFSGVQPVRGSGRVEERTYDVEDFSGVVLADQGNLIIEYGAREALVVEAEEYILPYLEVEVEDHILRLGTRPNVWLRPTRLIRYHLTVTELNSVAVTGSGNVEGPVLEGDDVQVRITGSGDVTLDGAEARDSVTIKGTGSGNARIRGGVRSGGADGAGVRGDRVHVTVTGSGDVTLGHLESDRLEVRLTGSGDLAVDGGRVAGQTVSISSSGVYRARGLESATADVRVSGSGTVNIRVADELDASLTGSGDVRYAGDPAVRKDTSGSGHVKRVAGTLDQSTD